jgi:hypothetical protein
VLVAENAEQLREGLGDLVEMSHYSGVGWMCEADGDRIDLADDAKKITHRILRIKPWEGWREALLLALSGAVVRSETWQTISQIDTPMMNLDECLEFLGITLEIDCDEPGCVDGWVYSPPCSHGCHNHVSHPCEKCGSQAGKKPCPKCGGGR